MATPKRLTVTLPSSSVDNHPEDDEIDWPARVRVLQASLIRAQWEAERAGARQ